MRNQLRITGMVQGVGFRPFVHRLATKHALSGWVKNATDGVHIEVEGDPNNLADFTIELQKEKPAHAEIHSLFVREIPDLHETGFTIADSELPTQSVPLLSPDLSVCPDCSREAKSPGNRRFQYPFTNCTHCGPRYTIIKQAPYDRQNTTMGTFTMCPDCQREYDDPSDRRFHAQPNACPVCGPSFRLTDNKGVPVPFSENGNVLSLARMLVQSGKIVAVKGLGGFHFACDAKNEEAVSALRRRKIREDKPFAIMAGSLSAVKEICALSFEEEAVLTGSIRPILLLDKTSGYHLADSVAPCNPRIGVMLPYTPAHEQLVGPGDIWVMTSGNSSDEPIAYVNEDALARLCGIADYFLFHDRDIYRRADDSVVRIFQSTPYLFRRSRGYTPLPISLARSTVPVLACGGELKNTFCLTHGRQAFVSSHIGDLENDSTYQYFIDSINYYKNLFHIQPEAIAYDLHPEYLSTKYAKACSLPQMGIQHHHAHIASVMAEHGLYEPVIGVAFDGSGYGEDGAIWGGEFLIADCRDYARAAHLRYLPLPGAAMAIKQPWRMAAWILFELFGEKFMEKQIPFACSLPPEWPVVISAAGKGINTPLTSSAGRLFDAAAALLSIRRSIHYEGQAAVELELAAGTQKGEILPYGIKEGSPRQLDFLPAFAALASLLQQGKSAGTLAASFHTTIAHAVVDMLIRIRKDTAIRKVALSGGVFQNLRLLSELSELLTEKQFTVYRHRQVPANDGGLSLGQAVIAGERCR